MSEAGQGLSFAFAASFAMDEKEKKEKKLRQRTINALTWMIAHFDFMNQQTELGGGDSPELTEAKELLEELKND